MDISQLEYFAAVARVKSMTKAARLLNLTQPALSMSIKRIEEEIGVPLFDRSGRTVSLNENGETFYNAATEMLRLYYEAKDTILTINGTALRIRLCFIVLLLISVIGIW